MPKQATPNRRMILSHRRYMKNIRAIPRRL
jgi:hypothetical protein